MITKEIGDLSADEREKLRAILDIINEFAEKEKNMPIQMIRTFLLVALHERDGLGTLALAKKAVLGDTVMARHLADLGEMDRTKQAGTGHDLVDMRINPMDRRFRKAVLTDKGRAFRNKLIRIITKACT